MSEPSRETGRHKGHVARFCARERRATEIATVYLYERCSVAELARQAGVSRARIGQLIRSVGVTREHRRRAAVGFALALVHQGVSVRVAAADLRVGRDTLSRWLREWGMEPAQAYQSRRALRVRPHGDVKVCGKCGHRKPITDFYVRQSRGRPYVNAQCKLCEMGRLKAHHGGLQEAAKKLGVYERDVLRRGRAEAARRAERRLERSRRRAAREAEREAHRLAVPARRSSKIAPLVERLLLEDPSARALARSTQKYRARYRYDDEFKAKELRRRYAQKLKAPVPTDGTLDGAELRRMFAGAKHCEMCGRRMRSRDKTLDHIHPKSKGGVHSVLNARVVCRSCNTRKRDRLPEQTVLGCA